VTVLPLKPALFAGFLLLGATLPLAAQDYVDVEAERRAAAQNPSVPQGAVAEDAAADYAGIRPYAGSTTVASPPSDVSGAVNSGSDSGSLVLRVQQLEADVRRLTGLLEEANQALVRMEAQSLERYVDLDRRIAAGTKTDAAEGAEDAATATPMVPPAAGGAAPGRTGAADSQAGEEAAYRAAYELVREKSFDAAVAAFLLFLEDFPFGRYAPNAHYWLGELYLVIDPPDPELARQSFKMLLDQYPADPKVPDALYKLGRVQFIKGNRQRSQEYLDEVIREYPSHAAAQLARQFLLENF
jgi:tol-pal system protein YbgF